jgi:hypothetical protein
MTGHADCQILHIGLSGEVGEDVFEDVYLMRFLVLSSCPPNASNGYLYDCYRNLKLFTRSVVLLRIYP